MGQTTQESSIETSEVRWGFVTLEGRTHPPWEGRVDAGRLIARFLEGQEASAAPRTADAACRLDEGRRALLIDGATVGLTRLEFGVLQSPVGCTPAGSTIRITVFSGARVRWTTPWGTVKPCPGVSSTLRPSRSISSRPLTT